MSSSSGSSSLRDDSGSDIDITSRVYTDSRGKKYLVPGNHKGKTQTEDDGEVEVVEEEVSILRIEQTSQKKKKPSKTSNTNAVTPTAGAKRAAEEHPDERQNKKPKSEIFPFFSSNDSPKRTARSSTRTGKFRGLMTVSVQPLVDIIIPKIEEADELEDVSSINSYEEREERIRDIRKWKPAYPSKVHKNVDDMQKANIQMIMNRTQTRCRNVYISDKLGNLYLQLKKKEAETKLQYPNLRLRDKSFFMYYLEDYANIIRRFPIPVEILSWQAFYDYFKDCTEKDAKFLQRFCRYQPDKVLVRVIADLERETFTFTTEFDEYNKVFFESGGEGVGFLD